MVDYQLVFQNIMQVMVIWLLQEATLFVIVWLSAQVAAVVEDMAAAEEFAKRDPYRKVGLFESVEIEQIRKVIPADD